MHKILIPKDSNRVKEIDMKRLLVLDIEVPIKKGVLMKLRDAGNFKGKSIDLSDSCDWVIGYDELNSLILIPMMKED